MKNRIGAIVASIVLGAGLITAPHAAAEPVPEITSPQTIEMNTPLTETPEDNATVEEIEKLKSELDASGTPRSERIIDGRLYTTFEIEGEDGARAAIVTNEPDPNSIRSALRVTAGWGIYVYFNYVDQQMLMDGQINEVVQLICTFPDPFAGAICLGAYTASVVASNHITNYGFCPNELEVNIPRGNPKCA